MYRFVIFEWLFFQSHLWSQSATYNLHYHDFQLLIITFSSLNSLADDFHESYMFSDDSTTLSSCWRRRWTLSSVAPWIASYLTSSSARNLTRSHSSQSQRKSQKKCRSEVSFDIVPGVLFDMVPLCKDGMNIQFVFEILNILWNVFSLFNSKICHM